MPKFRSGLLLLLLSACTQAPKVSSSSEGVAFSRLLPLPDTALMPGFSTYRIGPLDTLTIEVFGAADLTRTGTVDLAGNFSMPLIGTVSAGDRTPEQLAALIAGRLRGRYLKAPEVTVNVKEPRGRQVTVDGSVRDPGNYPVIGRMTLQQAIAQAKGASDLADLHKIVVFRTVKDRKLAALFDLKDIRAGRYADPQLFADDIVIVGENATRRFLKDVSTSFPPLGAFVPVL